MPSVRKDSEVLKPTDPFVERHVGPRLADIEKMLDGGLPEKYTVDLFEQKCGALFQHVLEKYPQRDGSVYDVAVA